MDPTSPSLDATEAAEHFGAGISARTVTRLAKSGHLSHYRVGRFLRFSPADLDAYLATCRAPATSNSTPTASS